MSQSACLHVQANESDPVRVVELRGGSIRIGRAAYCDVRLNEPEIANEACRLRLRGGSWHLFPVSGAGLVRVDGLAVEHPTLVAFDQAFQVGRYWLTLRSLETSAWGSIPVPRTEPRLEEIISTPVQPATGYALTTEIVTRRSKPRNGLGPDEDHWQYAQRGTEEWESRWRAAGEKLRAATVKPRIEVPEPPRSQPLPVRSKRERPVRTELLESPLTRRTDFAVPAPSAPIPRQSLERVRTKTRPTITPLPSAARIGTTVKPAPVSPPATPVVKREHVEFSAPRHVVEPKRPVATLAVPRLIPTSKFNEEYDSGDVILIPEDSPVTTDSGPTATSPQDEVEDVVLVQDWVPVRKSLEPVDPARPSPSSATEISALNAPSVDIERARRTEIRKALEESAAKRRSRERRRAGAGSLVILEPTVVENDVKSRGRSGAEMRRSVESGWAPSQETAISTVVANEREMPSAPVAEIAPVAALESTWDQVEDLQERPALGIARQVERDPEAVNEPLPATSELEPAPHGLEGFHSEGDLHAKRRLRRKRMASRPSRVPEPSPVAAEGEPILERPRAELTTESNEPFSSRRHDSKASWCYEGPFVADTNLVEDLEPRETNRRYDQRTKPRGRNTRPSEARTRSEFSHDYDPLFQAKVGYAASALTSPQPTNRDWPTVGDILAAQGLRAKTETPQAVSAAKKSTQVRRPEPTLSKPPGQWTLPLWLAWFPAVLMVLGLGVVMLFLNLTWARDSYNAGIIAARLDGSGAEKKRKPLPDGVAPGGEGWWRSTANHLAQWAVYLDGSQDPAESEEARSLLDRANESAPLHPAVRYAKAHRIPGQEVSPPELMVRSLGQSRDVLSLTWAGHQLLAAGKKEAAIRAYRDALLMATRPNVERQFTPKFLDDSQIRRFALPTEDFIAPIIRDMADSTAWTYREWSEAVPHGSAAGVVVARVLREKGGADSDTALDAALVDHESTAEGGEVASAIRLAAEAEALAMKQRKTEASERYRQAIERMPSDTIRRSWWFNLAEIARSLNEQSNQRTALEQAKNSDMKDEITLRAVELQRASGLSTTRSLGMSVGTSGPRADSRQ